jgi:hypothetical protein
VFHEISQGVRPALGDAAKAANFLPAVLEDQFNNEWWVILAGTILSMDKTLAGVQKIVPANGASAQTITYTASDVGYTVDVDTLLTDATLVSAAGSASATVPSNKPIGWAWHHMYSGSIEDRLINYELQPHVSILCDYEIEVGLIDDTDNEQDFTAGDLIKPGVTGTRQGLPHIWVDGTDTADQICGRVLYRDTIPTGTSSRSRIDLVKPVRGFNLSGVETEGRPRHLDAYQLAAPTTKITDFIRVNITLL